MDRYRTFQRKNGMYFSFDKLTNRQASLKTKDCETAQRLLEALNESVRNPGINRRMGQVYLSAADPQLIKRTWSDVVEKYRLSRVLKQSTLDRLLRAEAAKPMQRLLKRVLIETTSEEFLELINSGGVSVNVYLRRWHNFAVGMDWLPKSILPKAIWPTPEHDEKRAITLEEHRVLIDHIEREEWKDYLEVLWWTGGSQADIAEITRARVNFFAKTIAFQRKKMQRKKKQNSQGGMTHLRMGNVLFEILERRLAVNDLAFPYLAGIRTVDRATYFRRFCNRTGLSKELTLHCYRYAVCERMYEIGYNSRHAKALVGHASMRMHEKYSRNADITCAALEDAERIFRLSEKEAA
jgi:site-specific recombinase XerD